MRLLVVGGKVERRLAADVAGYSRLMGVDEEGTLSALKSIKRETVDPKVKEYGGRLVKTTGDGMLLLFPSVVQAVRYAVEVQHAMADRNQTVPEPQRIAFRIGINVGDVILEDGDVFGDGVNIAARLEQIAKPSGITISDRVHDDVRDKLAVSFKEGGAQRLKNISRPVNVWRWPGDSKEPPKRPVEVEVDWERQKIQYCRAADGVRLAYAAVGNGQPLVKADGFLSHLKYDHAVWGPAWGRLAAKYKFLRCDTRGNGLSDWEVSDLSVDAWVRDLEAVVDAAGLERFALMGFSQGCATSIDYAVRHPERVSHLILYGGYPRGAFRIGDKDCEASQRAQATLMRVGWESPTSAFRQMFSTRMIPNMSPVQAKAFDELLQASCDGDLAERYQLACGDLDVLDLLPKVRVPMLVLHVRDDAMVSIDGGRALADGIPGARFVSIPGRNHVPIPGEPAGERSFEEIDRFLSEISADAK